VLHTFFEIKAFDLIPQFYDRGPTSRGLYENNGVHKRLRAITNQNTDASNFRECSATGMRPIDESNETRELPHLRSESLTSGRGCRSVTVS
jgi:hypothetical protein